MIESDPGSLPRPRLRYGHERLRGRRRAPSVSILWSCRSVCWWLWASPRESAEERFGFLLEAFRYGAPPMAGMAFGLDRLVMLLLGKESIKDVIAFPKVQNASELMSGCPAEVEDKSLAELAIKVDLPQE